MWPWSSRPDRALVLAISFSVKATEFPELTPRENPLRPKSDHLHANLSFSPYDMDPESPAPDGQLEATAIDSVLRKKRKRRAQRVCQPCRSRKVRCTCETPCRSCLERGHPELCLYDADAPVPSKRVNASPQTDNSERWLPSKQEWHDMSDRLADIERLLRELVKPVPKRSLDSGSPLDADIIQGISVGNALTGDTVHLGGNSVPAMVAALAHDSSKDNAVQDLLNKSILPVFGLDNESATYPFVDLWGISHGSFRRIELLCKLLPATDSECMQIFKHYRDTAHAIYPGIVDIVQFESDLLEFLRDRHNNQLALQTGTLANQTVYTKDLHWLGLLFAALASGFQCSDLPRKERQMKSQVYGMLKRGEVFYCFVLTFGASCLRTSVYV